MKAIIIRGTFTSVERDVPKPKHRDDYIIVKTIAIALNPTDWKHIEGGVGADGGFSGCDYAGLVEEIGAAVTKRWKKGDRVCGCAHGANRSNAEDGVFAEYAVVKGDLQMKIPDAMTFEAAATIGLGSATCGQGLYQKALKMNLPSHPIQERQHVLVYGGSTATGALSLQYANLSGYTVIATCSPHSNDFVKSRGADFIFDHKEPGIGAKIRQLTNNQLKLAWDTIGTDNSAQICAEALSTEPGCRYGTTLFNTCPRKDVTTVGTLMYTIFGEAFEYRGEMREASLEDFDFSKTFADATAELLKEGKLKAHPVKIGANGLEEALEGMQLMKAGKVSGQKLVYLVDETP